MKLVKDLKILTEAEMKDVEMKYQNKWYIVKTYSTNFYKNFSQSCINSKVYDSKEEAQKDIPNDSYSDNYHGVDYSIMPLFEGLWMN